MENIHSTAKDVLFLSLNFAPGKKRGKNISISFSRPKNLNKVCTLTGIDLGLATCSLNVDSWIMTP